MDSVRTAEQIREVCDGMRLSSRGIDFVVIDYLQRIHSPDSQRERRIQVEQTSNSLKSLAQEFKIPVLCLSAVSRPAKGQSTRPTMESLKESSNLEHDADVILLLDRGVKESETTLLVAKARDGETGLIDLVFEAQNVRFVETDAA